MYTQQLFRLRPGIAQVPFSFPTKQGALAETDQV